MAHNHAHAGHSHDHSHSHTISPDQINRAFIIGIILNFLFIVIEVIVGLSIDSMSVLSDAGHNLADVGGLGLSLLAFRMLKVKSNERYTYGYRKTTVLTALLNAVLLLVSIGAIVYEAIDHLIHPQPLPGRTIAIIAGIGIFINAGSAYFFMKDQHKDLNIKSAYLHLMADAAVSLGLVIGGIIIYFTSWYWLDSVLGILIAVTILVSTWKLLKDSLRLSLDGVPKDIDLEKIKEESLKVEGVKRIYHIHVWAISTAENAMTAHVVLRSDLDREKEICVKEELRHSMLHLNIQHVTIETEWEHERITEKKC